MKRFTALSNGVASVVPALAAAAAVLFPAAAAAAAGDGWRPTYDLIMRWLNFAILAFILVKYGRKPLVDFFRGQRDKVKAELDRMESERVAARKKLEDMQAEKEASRRRLQALKERIVEQGEKRKQQLIDSATAESKVVMESAARKVDYQVIKARRQLRAELVDMAVNRALERLPREITREDNQKIVRQYLEKTETASPAHAAS